MNVCVHLIQGGLDNNVLSEVLHQIMVFRASINVALMAVIRMNQSVISTFRGVNVGHKQMRAAKMLRYNFYLCVHLMFVCEEKSRKKCQIMKLQFFFLPFQLLNYECGVYSTTETWCSQPS